MKNYFLSIISILLISVSLGLNAQVDSVDYHNDSINRGVLVEFYKKLAIVELQRTQDSIRKVELEAQLQKLKTTDNLPKEDLIKQLKSIEENELKRIAEKKNQIESLRNTAKGFPVIGELKDTLFLIYSKIGAATPQERAATINTKIGRLYDDDFLKLDSIKVQKSENTYDVVYKDIIIMSVSESDAIWYGATISALSENFKELIKNSIAEAKRENTWLKILARIGLVVLVLLIAYFFIWLISKGYTKVTNEIKDKKGVWLKDLSYRDYTFLTADQQLNIILFLIKVFRWFIYALLLYISLPIIFSIFPFSRNWADALFQLIWSPFKGVLLAIWNYLPNLFSILVIYFVMKYINRFVKYVFREIESEKLKITSFHPDWAMPTYSIVRFLLYAFMVVMIYQYLPSSDSDIFKGVSVFIGILFSFGSTSAIANMVAGLVITYMRPFKIGDRIKIGEVSGDVLEKNLLVTRIKTIKNEVVTIPNSAVLTGSTTNYSAETIERGLIVHTTITIGYDVPWKIMHEALIEAANRTGLLMKEPRPFVLQTSLDDFYVSYQINAYTREASKQAIIYSELHQNIQDVCHEKGIEILSPHYRAARDGNGVAIPESYLPKDYQPKPFNVNTSK